MDGEVERSTAGSDCRHVSHREVRHLRGRLQLRHHGQVCCNTSQIEILLLIFMYRSHYEGKNHEKKLRACLEMYCRKHGLEVPARVTTEAEETFETHCKVRQPVN